MTETTTETKKNETDPELRAMKRMSDALSALDDKTRTRVVAYFASRYLPAGTP